MSITATSPHWILTFADDFEGPAGSAPSSIHWTHDIGGGGWGNNEWQSYTADSQNAFLDGNGNLVIEARQVSTIGPDGIERPYSSARIHTQGKVSQKFGRIEAKIKLPQGKGIWPAFWMLGDDFDTKGWPECGEIDIMESIDVVAQRAHGTIHGPGYCGGEAISNEFQTNQFLVNDFHLYAVEWAPESISWFFDDHCYATVKSSQVNGNRWAFDHPFFVVLNLAIGGNWPGYPDETTSFPQRLTVDFVKFYERG